jgi:hypothetical protein
MGTGGNKAYSQQLSMIEESKKENEGPSWGGGETGGIKQVIEARRSAELKRRAGTSSG